MRFHVVVQKLTLLDVRVLMMPNFLPRNISLFHFTALWPNTDMNSALYVQPTTTACWTGQQLMAGHFLRCRAEDSPRINPKYPKYMFIILIKVFFRTSTCNGIAWHDQHSAKIWFIFIKWIWLVGPPITGCWPAMQGLKPHIVWPCLLGLWHGWLLTS